MVCYGFIRCLETESLTGEIVNEISKISHVDLLGSKMVLKVSNKYDFHWIHTLYRFRLD
jgi:hypothetical protein